MQWQASRSPTRSVGLGGEAFRCCCLADISSAAVIGWVTREMGRGRWARLFQMCRSDFHPKVRPQDFRNGSRPRGTKAHWPVLIASLLQRSTWGTWGSYPPTVRSLSGSSHPSTTTDDTVRLVFEAVLSHAGKATFVGAREEKLD